MSVDSAVSFAISNGLISEFEKAECSKILKSSESDDFKIKKLQILKFGNDYSRLDEIVNSFTEIPMEDDAGIVEEILQKEISESQKFQTEKQSSVQELR